MTGAGERRYALVVSPTVRRQLAVELPEPVAAAALEFITGPLLDNPRRLGKPLSGPFHGRYAARRGTYRIVYLIDDEALEVTVVLVSHRHDAYRRR